MPRIRFSLLSLMGVIAVVAVGCAALRSASQLWMSATFSAAVGLLSLAILAAIYLAGRERAFCVGAALSGWFYMVLAFAPWFDRHVGPMLVTTNVLDLVRERSQGSGKLSSPAAGVPVQRLDLPTEFTDLMQVEAPGTAAASATVSDPTILQATLNSTDPSAIDLKTGNRPGTSDIVVTDQGGGQQVFRVTVVLDRYRFPRIGHSLAAILIALLGGTSAWYFYGVRQRRYTERDQLDGVSAQLQHQPNATDGRS